MIGTVAPDDEAAVAVDDEATSTPTRRPSAAVTVLVLVAWAVLVAVTRRYGQHLVAGRGFEQIRLGSPPLVGRDDLVWSLRTLLPVGVAALAVAALPVAARRCPWRVLLAVVLAAAVVWPVALNLTRGWDGITGPLLREEDEYLLDVPLVESPSVLLESFTERIDDFNPHVRSHPPGFLLLLWSLDAAGLTGAGWAAALCVAVGASAAVAVLVTVREVAGERVARRAAPFVAVAPLALWIATSADALYAGVGAWAIALLVLASGRRRRSARSVLALASGLLFGAALMFSYGLALLAVIALPVVWKRRAVGPTAVAALIAVGLVLAFLPFGFDYVDGFRTAQREVGESVQATRPFAYFAFSNLAALAIACGPAVAVGLGRLRDRRLWLLVGGAVAAVLLADLSALSKGEVERIWLPFAVWLLPAAAALAPDRSAGGGRAERVRAWLVLQVAVALAVQTWIRTGW